MDKRDKPLSKRQIKALDGSIKKWRDIVDRAGIDNGGNNCPCCKLYHNNHCVLCPIKIYTGYKYCLGTPYYDFAYNSVVNEKSKKLAQAELDFLIEVKQHFERVKNKNKPERINYE